MATVKLIEPEEAKGKVKEIFDDISKTRGGDKVNNIWKALANDPDLLESTWNRIKQVMVPGALDSVTKELIYIAVSIVNGCEYCIHSHTATARKKGMTEEMRSELLAVVAMASQTNSLANAYQIDVDDSFKK
ncbi:carboxymuconolactone decarboxylase family protein [Alphaproteobacteria bacterium]|nr:carboxymuconolactone decarboxylase family protein [Alphaproteobacteria bacterium]